MEEVLRDQIVAGRKPLLEAFRAGRPIEKVVMLPGVEGDEIKLIRSMCVKAGIPVQTVPEEKFDYLLRKSEGGNRVVHQGIMALVSPIRYFELDELLEKAFAEGHIPLLVLLDKITDVRNLGGIARSALSFASDGLIVPTDGAARITVDGIKASAGALQRIPVCRVKSLSITIKTLKAHGIRILAAEQGDGITADDIDWSQPTALIFGSEGEGIGEEVLKLADQKISIPMPGDFESLNVSVAAGIILHAAARSRAK